MEDPWEVVRMFERSVAEYAGSRYAVAVDTGTAALFLACKYLKVGRVSLPRKTYVSVPCAVIHAGGTVEFDDRRWIGEYTLDPYPIVDSACRFRRGMHRPRTFRCLSFQYRKHLPIGRGGMILCDDAEAVRWLKLARFSGRREVPLSQDNPTMIGWHLFMEPERAARGLTLLSVLPEDNDDLCFNYPDLSQFEAYRCGNS
jgi:dTDP-4-amino-4,6-dideoxygalactose transaminase